MQTSFQAQITKKIEDLQYFLYIINKIRYHKKKAYKL